MTLAIFVIQILRATGKCFHPDCFKCEVCHKKLDGVQFTVDNFNKVHCIEDYYRYSLLTFTVYINLINCFQTTVTQKKNTLGSVLFMYNKAFIEQ